MRKFLFMSIIPVLFTSCIIDWQGLYWANPISGIQDAQVDDRLLGTWVMKNDKDGVFLHIGRENKNWMGLVYQESSELIFPCKMYVSRLNGRTFLNINLFAFDLKESREGYLIAEYEIKGRDKLMGYLPDPYFVRKAIEDKTLLGKIAPDTTITLADSSELIAFIRNSPKERLFSNILEFKRLEGF